MKVDVDFFQVPLAEPLDSARDSIAGRLLAVLSLDGGDAVGFGEAAPLPGYDVADAEMVLGGLEACIPVLERSDGSNQAELMARCSELTTFPQTLAAIDLALWDLAGKRAGAPVWRLLGAQDPAGVPVNATIGAVDRAGAASQASRALELGFGAVKVKVGVGDDAGRLAAIRAAAGREMLIRIDANGAWTIEQAIASLQALASTGLECCEEPVHGVDSIARVAEATDVPISIDETAVDPRTWTRRACTAVCLKISRCGGISGVVRDTARARAAGYEVYLASTLDGPLGIAAAVHCAAALGVDRPCGLATLGLFAGDQDPIPVHDGAIEPPGGVGLGDGLRDWYRAD